MQTKEAQGKLWSTAPADWVRYLEPTFIPLYQSVLSELKPDDSTTLLDAGCGSGLFLGMARKAGAHVFGVDAAPGLLAVSKKRLPGVTLMLEDLEELPFRDESFDVVTGFNSFQYAGNFENALREASRVTRADGRVVIAIWGQEKNCEASEILNAVGSMLPPPPPGTPGPFALSEEGRVEEIMARNGLRVVSRKSVSCPWQFPDTLSLQLAFLSTAPCVKAVHHSGEQKVREMIYQSAQAFNKGDQVYYMQNEFLYFIAEKI